jgi:hypothetical protein
MWTDFHGGEAKMAYSKKKEFFKLRIGGFFFTPMKISYGRMNGLNFDDYPGFQSKITPAKICNILHSVLVYGKHK